MANVEQIPYESECALDEHLVMMVIETIRDDDGSSNEDVRDLHILMKKNSGFCQR